ncbi:MAG: single-stranded DNA-binding protein [Spirochaetia bacterium]|jgi:single-strand DNA-binding protein|nr:single-stranded DNA-binding protein [Spirochaetia bacterium]
MPSDLNRVFMIGRLVRDPELRYTAGGTAVASFSIANNRSYTSNNEKKEQASFFNCVAWGKLGELIVQYCKKGNRIGIEGRLQQRSWDDQNGNKRSTVEVITDNIQFLSPRESSSGGDAPQIDINASYQDVPQPQEIDNNPFSDDDIPF